MMVAAVSASLNPKASSQGAIQRNTTKRPPLLSSEADNGVSGNRRPKSREVTSRYMSSRSSTSTTSTSASSSTYSSSSNSSSSTRCPSPLVSRTVPVTTPMPAHSAIKRSQSVERRRPVTPRPTTPEMSAAARLLVNSTRRLSVSYQGESVPTSKTKTAPSTNNLSNVRKGTPERRKAATPVRDQRENSKPIDQYRWPGRSRQVNSLMRSSDFTVEKTKFGGSGSVKELQKSMINESHKASFNGRLKVDSSNAELKKAAQLVVDPNSAIGSAVNSDPAASDSESVSSGSNSGMQECASVAQPRGGPRGVMVPARFWQETNNRVRRLPEPGSPVSRNNGLKPVGPPKLIAPKKLLNDSPSSSPRGVLSSRGLSSPLRGAVRPASPSKPVTSLTPYPSRGLASPTRVRNGVASTFNDNTSNTESIFNFAADIRRGKMGENRIVDAHMLRLMYNRQLQWRFVNARTEASLLVQRVTAEKRIYNAWVTTSKLWHSVKSKRMELQLLKQNLKLYSILKGQMLYLDSWNLIDRDHSSSLTGAIKALEASTLRLPVVGGARADIQNVKDAICSAVDVMQAMAPSICSLLSKVEQVNVVVSELANITANERALVDQCKDIMSTVTAMQVNDCSLRTHILQLKHVPSSLTTQV
ncbi:QWRF motif-containing protein 2-like isoform X1 [Cornus florida]|uniref:QWRF motif-containing protein 2-like isoform X1 n=1 Tax=Cornus florida TaxID=4283 RepID=UPI00289AD59A|nr:QWRF motif-containing protein 2-like isoform X1 [Cornus florida]